MFELPGYEATELISEGPRTTVYRIKRSGDDRRLLAKTITTYQTDHESAARFRNELDILDNLDLAGVAKPLDVIDSAYGLVLILEEIVGRPLAEIIANGLPLPAFFSHAITLTEILGRVHQQGIVHKDINPRNIIITEDGEPYLIDFGLAGKGVRERGNLVHPKILEGTLAYMSPEQTGRLNRSVDYRTDIYSLGVTFFQMLTGRLPYETSDPMALIYCHVAREIPLACDVRPSVPRVLSSLVARMMAKNAEDRYQSCSGLFDDLEHCRDAWQRKGRIAPFPLGENDVSPLFHLPEKLYGRDSEVERLQSTYQRMTKLGRELLLVSGYSGVGKSSLVREVYRQMAGSTGYFITGKFDRFARDSPYSALIQAFRDLCRQWLSEPPEQIARWRERLDKALGTNGQVILDLIPELEAIIGEQPQVESLDATKTGNRFNLVFRDFLHCIAREDHPLVLFVDDLQWADSASFNLLQMLFTDPRLNHLLFIGTFRDNEVDAHHPLEHMLENLGKRGIAWQHMQLTPLNVEDITRLLTDTFSVDAEDASGLARILTVKTHGNPFFLRAFLKTLNEREMLFFDHNQGGWKWHVEEIDRLSSTLNVIDLITRKLELLSPSLQQTLRLAACIGHVFDLATLAHVSGQSPGELAQALTRALEQDMIQVAAGALQRALGLPEIPEETASGIAFRFAHDRIHHAAESMLTPREREDVHYRIACYLRERFGEKEKLMEIVNHFKQGGEIPSEERQGVSGLYLEAGKKAKSNNAYDAALTYLRLGISLLPEHPWKTCYTLTMALYEENAEIEYIGGHFEAGEKASDIALTNARDITGKIRVMQRRIVHYGAANRAPDALQTAVRALEMLDINIPAEVGPQEIENARERVWSAIGIQPLESLLDAPLIQDKRWDMAMTIFGLSSASAYFVNPNLFALMTLMAMEITVREGNNPYTGVTYSAFSIFLLRDSENVPSAIRFGDLSLAFDKKFQFRALSGRTNIMANLQVRHWGWPVHGVLDSLRDGMRSALETGDLEYFGYGYINHLSTSVVSGSPLDRLEEEFVRNQPLLEEYHLVMALGVCRFWVQAVHNLRSESEDSVTLAGPYFDESKIAAYDENKKNLTVAFQFHFAKVVLAVFFSKWDIAEREVMQSWSNLNRFYSVFVVTKFYFYAAVVAINKARTDSANREAFLEKAQTYLDDLKHWGSHASENRAHEIAFLEAEFAREENRLNVALRGYDKAIALARENGFVHDLALICRQSALFYRQLELSRGYHAYLQESFRAFKQWGAEAILASMKREHGHHLSQESDSQLDSLVTRSFTTSHSLGSSEDSFDLMSVLRAGQAISEEIELEPLLRRLIHVLVETCGARRAVLAFQREGRLRILADADMGDGQFDLPRRTYLEDFPRLPHSLILYVIRTGNSVAHDDAASASPFSKDPYIQENRIRSVLCSPLVRNKEVAGVIYLENALARGLFTPRRREVVDMLASQVAISVQNATMYTNLKSVTGELREAKVALEDYSKTLEHKVRERTDELTVSNRQLVEKNEQILNSINYARYIQAAVLPDPASLRNLPVPAFAFYRPRDIVSGDFCWFNQRDNFIFFAAVDCTGHGVPGAFLSLIGNALLESILGEFGPLEPADMLTHLDAEVRKVLHQQQSDLHDLGGMDICLCRIDLEGRELRFVGARRPLVFIQEQDGRPILEEIKGHRRSIGGRPRRKPEPFKDHVIALHGGETFYLTTDGFADQPGSTRRKYGNRQLRKYLGDLARLPLAKQEAALEGHFETWREGHPQRDDITIIGVEVPG